MPENPNLPKRGIGVYFGALGVAFVVLKLCGVVDWSWWWVLAPLWAPLVAAVVVVLVAALTWKALPGTTGRTGGGGGRPPETAHEPIHGWTKRQLDGYLLRNPGYRAIYEAELAERR